MSQAESGTFHSPERTDSIIKISRGTTAVNKRFALSYGLAMGNQDRPTWFGDQTPPGLFFYFDTTNAGGLSQASFLANRVDELGVVIEIDVTPENFKHLKRKVQLVEKHKDRSYTYSRLRSFRKLRKKFHKQDGKGEVTVNMGKLSQEDLVKLGVKVGFGRSDDDFTFKTYEEWTDEMGIERTNSRIEPNRLFTLFTRKGGRI